MKKSYVVLFHIVFWLPQLFQTFTWLFVYSKIASNPGSVYKLNLVSTSIGFGFCAAIFYFFYLYLFPLFLNRQKIKQFLIIGFLVCITAAIINQVFIHYLLIQYQLDASTYMNYMQDINDGLALFRLTSVGVIACMLRGFIGWYNDIKYKKELENRNLQTELALLKAQINPHFLFNTLNNIDVLIEKDSATASVYLKKLSDLLRFTLYESPAETIPLAKEISGIEQYIDLQRIRTSNPDFVKFEVKGDVDGLFVAPMIFMPFVENAFKHSTNKKIDSGIDISITIDNDMIGFSCVNVFDDTQVLEQANSGLGLELINSRLNLFYQGNHTLSISKENNLFSVSLMIRAHDN